MDNKHEHWDLVIDGNTSLFRLGLRDVFRYRDLLWLLVKRDIVTLYKQTVLGPLWFIIQPLLTTLVFTIVFGGMAKLSTNGLPPALFYMAGIVPWSYFSTSLTATSNTFVTNASIFGKVYFPRLVMPIAIVISNLAKFAFQYLIFVAVWLYYLITSDIEYNLTGILLGTPFLLLTMALLGLSFGIVISSLTTKYRDFRFLVEFGVQLWMYASPVIYSLQSVSATHRAVVIWNPMSPVIEAFRMWYVSGGMVTSAELFYSFAFAVLLFIPAALLFNRVEKNFMDTV